MAVSKAMQTAVEANGKEQPRHFTQEQRDKRNAERQRCYERHERQHEMHERAKMAYEDYDEEIVDMGGYNARVCRPRDPAAAEAFKSLRRRDTTARESTVIEVMAQPIQSFAPSFVPSSSFIPSFAASLVPSSVPSPRDQGHRAISHTEGYYACKSGGTPFAEAERMLMQGNQPDWDPPERADDEPYDCDEEQEERRRRLREHKAAEAMSHKEG